MEKMFLKISQNSQGDTCGEVSFFTKIACNFIKKENPTQVLPCEFCEIYKNSFFIEYLRQLLLLINNLNLNSTHNTGI